MPRHSSKNRKVNNRVHYKGRNIVLTLILLMCLFVIYKFNFETKSEEIKTTKVAFSEYVENDFSENNEMREKEVVVLEVNEDISGNKYIQFPKTVSGYYADKYRLVSGNKIAEEEDNETKSNSNTNNTNAVSNDNNVNEIQNVQNTVNNSISENNTNTNNEYKGFSYLQVGGNKKTFYSEDSIESADFEKNEDTPTNLISSDEKDAQENEAATSNDNTLVNEENNENTQLQEEVENTQSNENDTNVVEEENETENTGNEIDNTDNGSEVEVPEKKDEEEQPKNTSKETIRETYFVPGEKYFIDEDVSLEFEVLYKTAVINGKKLYKQDITYEDQGTIITATGYIPAGYVLNVLPEDKDEMMELKKDVVMENDAVKLEDTDILAAYDISIVKKEMSDLGEDDGKIIDEYQPNEYYQTIELSITSEEELKGHLRNSTIIPVHVKKSTQEVTDENGETYEAETYQFDQINIKNHTNDTIEFYTDSFSPFLVLQLRQVTANYMIIDDAEADKNFYTGKNYTDDGSGVNQNLYTSANEVEVTVNYHGFDTVNGPMKQVQATDEQGNPLFDEVTGDPVMEDEPVSGYVSSTERQNLLIYQHTCYKDASNNIKIELIDNPFMDRPAGYGFDGWLAHTNAYTITTDNKTFEQTLTTNVGTNTAVTIDVYVRWSVANYIFWASDGVDSYQVPNGNGYITVTNDGKDPDRPLRTFNTATTNLQNNSNYKTTTNASNRELNILVIKNGSFNVFTPSKAITITSLYDGEDNSNRTYMNVNDNLILSADYQIDFLRIDNSRRYNLDFNYKNYYINSYIGSNAYYLSGNGHNLRIGRGVRTVNADTNTNKYTTFTQVFGGPNSTNTSSNSSISVNNYKLVVESGKYHNILTGSPSYRYTRNNSYSRYYATYTAFAKTVIGNDIDRKTNVNNNLNVYAGYASRTGAGTVTADASGYLYDVVVKSGNIGIDLFNDARNSGGNDPDYPYAGIYLGGHGNAAGDKGHRRLRIDGGNISNVMGGLGIQESDANTYKTQVYIKGGTIINVVGGAGRSTTHGNRMIQVTGGTIKYSVSGASNGFFSASSDPGDLNGDTLVYVGGTAIIGDATDTLYGVKAGSVLGAGNGNNTASIADSVGRANSTHVIIDGEATVNGDVYGGGNYGQVKPKNYSEPTPTYTITRENKSNDYNTTDEYIISNGPGVGSSYINYSNGNNYRVTRSSLTSNTQVANTAKWKLVQHGNYYYIRNVSNNRYLNIRYNYNTNWQGVQYNFRYEVCTSNNAQDFTLTNVSGNRVAISAVANSQTRYVDPSIDGDTGLNNITYYFCNTDQIGIYLLKETRELVPVSEDTPANVVSTIDVLNGSIKGDVYGGSNNNNICGSVQINVKGGETDGTVYGGSNTSGEVKQYSEINVTGGKIGDSQTDDAIFAGGKGEDTLISYKVRVNISDADGNVEINGNIYGGSERGTVNGTSKVIVDEDISNTDPKIVIKGKIFGGGKGTNTLSAVNGSDTEVNINGLDSESTVTVFGGANVNGKTNGNILVKIGENKTTVVDEVYGGGESAEVTTDTDTVYVYVYGNATVRNVFGGGNEAGIAGNNSTLPRAVYINGATITNNVYGGSNSSGVLTHSNVHMTNGATANEVYGGGYGSSTEVGYTNVQFSNATANTIYGGGDSGIVTGGTTVYVLNSSGINDVYGAGKGTTAETTGNTSVTIDNSDITDTVYGGGNEGRVNGSTNVSSINGSSMDNIFGGGNEARVENNTKVTASGTTVTNIFGGGSIAVVGGSTEVIVSNGTNAVNVFGGGQGSAAQVNNQTSVHINGATISETVYGGGDSAGVSGSTTIVIENASTAKNVYGGGNQGDVANNTNITINACNISQNVYGGGNQGDVTKKATVVLNGATCNTLYGGGQAASVGSTDVSLINSAHVAKAFGGGQGSSAITTDSTKIVVNASTVNEDVYGGGDAGRVVGSTVVGLTNATIGDNAYAAGNGQSATVGKNSYIYAEGTTTVGKSLFGGGNAATTGDNSSDAWSIVDIAGATIGENVYGGANSSVIKGSAIVNIGNTAIEEFYANPVVRDKVNNANIYINNPNKMVTIVGEAASQVVTSDLDLGTIDIGGTVFGGGEQMVAGSSYTFDAISVEAVIDINIDGNGYDSTHPLDIGGSIFGSGNASSANRNGDVTIKNWGTYNEVKKFVSIQRTGTLEINNSFIALMGITDSTNFDARVPYSVNIVDDAIKLKDNSTVYFYNGANKVSGFESVYTDSVTGTEKYNKVHVVNNVYDENDALVYIVDGDQFKSASGERIAYIGQNNKYFSDSDKTQEVTQATLNIINELIESAARIETQSVTSDANNRLYMQSGKNLNITNDESNPELDPQHVKGMTFFGLFKEGATASGFYSGMYDTNYAPGTNIQRSEREFLSAYVMGLHYSSPEHDILVDGFYTNYENVDPASYENYQAMDDDLVNYHSTMYVSVITPTPKEAIYYRWYCRPGEQIFKYEGSLRASKFSTFGTANIALIFDDVHPNAEITILPNGVEVTTINEFGIYDKNTIPNIAATSEDALTKFGMAMKTSNSGWKLNGETEYFYDPITRTPSYTGTNKFEIENSNTIPEFNFYLFNSNNITEKRTLGVYTITMKMEYAIDALNKGTALLIFELTLDTEDYDDQVGYNAAVTPGEQFELFSSSTTNISNKSTFSTFFELAQENFMDTKIKGSEDLVRDYYSGFYRVLTTRSYVFPKDTTITMIDKSVAGNPKYYYYNVTQADVNNHKTEFRLTEFYDMGNKDLKYDEAAGQAIYYNPTTDYEYENFIFIFNFESSEFLGLNDALDYEPIVEHEPIGIEIRAPVMGVDRQMFTVLDVQRQYDMYFGIYKAETAIDISGVLSKNRIYLGNQVRLTATTNYNVATVSGGATMIYDTRYFDKKLGIVISIYERGKNGNPDRRLGGSDVLGISFSLNGNTYYPRADGTTRIKIAEKVSNVSSPIMFNTEGASLASGDYYFILQSFGSPDGIYFGTDVSAVSGQISFTIINDLFGLDVRVPDRESIVEGDNGHILNEEGRLSKTENSLEVTVNYSSGLANPFLGVSLYRRVYDEIYGNTYEKVDLDDLVQEDLEPVIISYSNTNLNTYEYEAFDVDYIHSHVSDNTQTESFTQTYTYEEGPLRTGTYKLVYTLYDRYDTQIVVDDGNGNNVYQDVQEYEKIGDDFAYIIVK